MTARTTVRLPDDLIRRAKRRAVADGTSLTALIEDGLRRILKEREPAKAKRVLPPVSTATGGLMPGIDLNDTAAIEEFDDLDRARRAK